jgi:hypothetical protein
MMAPGVRCSTVTDANGQVHTELPPIRAFGVRDIGQVVEHRITCVYDSVGHYIRFANGGYLNYMADRRGNVIEFFLAGLEAVMSADGDITVWQSDAQT